MMYSYLIKEKAVNQPQVYIEEKFPFGSDSSVLGPSQVCKVSLLISKVGRSLK